MEKRVDIPLLLCSLVMFGLIFADVLQGLTILVFSIVLVLINKYKYKLEISNINYYPLFGISSIICGILIGSYGRYPLISGVIKNFSIEKVYSDPTNKIREYSLVYNSFLIKVLAIIYLAIFIYSLFLLLSSFKYNQNDKIRIVVIDIVFNLYISILYFEIFLAKFKLLSLVVTIVIGAIYCLYIFFNKMKYNLSYKILKYELKKIIFLVANIGLTDFVLYFLYAGIFMGRSGGDSFSGKEFGEGLTNFYSKLFSISVANLSVVIIAFLVIYKGVTFFRASDYLISEAICDFQKD